jgi:PAB-dependent poly(A)-specific ribonuclease subunit 3
MFGTRLLTEMNAIQGCVDIVTVQPRLILPAGTRYADQLEGELMSELENGRLVRLMSKLGFINERPEYVRIVDFISGSPKIVHSFSHELRWSETGDRYIISLFRDYVFHQVDESGNPVVNLTHVITCLNKVSIDTTLNWRISLSEHRDTEQLDAGIDERIMLVSRDEQTCFVVSYKEIKACIESAFGCVV